MIRKSEMYLSASEVAKLLRVSRQTVSLWIQDGTINNVVYVGEGRDRRYLLNRAEIMQIRRQRDKNNK